MVTIVQQKYITEDCGFHQQVRKLEFPLQGFDFSYANSGSKQLERYWFSSKEHHMHLPPQVTFFSACTRKGSN